MHEDDPTDMVHDQFAQVLFGDGPLGRPVLGTRRVDRDDRPRARSPATTGAATARRTWSSPSPATSTTPPSCAWSRVRSPPPGLGRRRRIARRPAAGRTARCRQRRRARHPPYDRAGQRRPRHARPEPSRRPSLRARRAQRRARRRHVVAAVPGGPREARAGLLGLQLSRAVRRHRPVRRLRRLRAAQGRRRARDLPRRAREGGRRTASPPRSSHAARASCAARWSSGSRTPARG